jgi:DNA polymerase-3 subunit epsilon
MNWLTGLFRAAPRLTPEQAERLARWRALPAVSEQTALADARFVVVDVETSGLNARRDRLLAIGAWAVQGARLVSGDAFSVVLRSDLVNPQARHPWRAVSLMCRMHECREGQGWPGAASIPSASERENILVHGIGPQAQAAGEEPVAGLLRFLEFAGKSPLVAYHARFDEVALDRALAAQLGVTLPNLWLDLACLAPALIPAARLPQGSLDQWLERFRLRVHERHRATADAFATAELFLILIKVARSQNVDKVGPLGAMAETHARLVAGPTHGL